MANILVIDDDHTLRSTLVQLLTSEGHQVLEADDGASGLKILQTSEVDLVLVDLLMPNMHGGVMIRDLKRTVRPMPGIILMTALRGWAEREHIGADAYLEKPFAVDDLLNAIEWVLFRSGDHTATPVGS